MSDSVALFIDLENVVTSLWNIHRRQPDLFGWMDKVRTYGSLAFGRAYGDFDQPTLSRLENDLRNLSIERFNCPVKQNGQSTVDGNIIMDLYEVALDFPQVKTFILMAGDSDYIRVVAKLRQRMDKRIVVMGVAGSVSRDLVKAAGNEDPIDVSSLPDVDEGKLVRLIDEYEASRRPGTLPVFRFMKEYVSHPRNHEIIGPEFVEGKLSDFVKRGVLVQEAVELDNGQVVKTTKLNRANDLVIDSFK